MSLKRRLPWSWIVAALGAAFLGTNLLRAAFADDPTRPRPKDIDKASRVLAPAGAGSQDERLQVPEGNWVCGNGVVEPADREVKVGAPASGRIAKVLVREGDKVEVGALLVELDSAVEAAALAVAEAELRTAQAELSRVVKGNRKEDVEAALADADAASARAGLSAGVAQRLVKAAEGGGATADEVERAQRQAQADQAAVSLADARKRAVVAGSRLEEVVTARAKVVAAEARCAQARAALEQRSVRAPSAGEVLQVEVRPGEFHQAGGPEPLLVLGDTTQLRVRVDVDERDVGKVAVGAPVKVRATAFPGKDFSGKLVELGRRMGRKNVRSDDPVERNDTKILEVVVALEGRDALFVGQRVTAYLAMAAPP